METDLGDKKKKNEAKTQWLCGCEGQREKKLKEGGKTGRDEDACQYIVKMGKKERKEERKEERKRRKRENTLKNIHRP